MFKFLPFDMAQHRDDSNSMPFLEGLVSDLMSDADAIALIQPHGYISVDTTSKNTGMSLGGVGSAITATPAGTTPSVHFIPGYFIEGTNDVPIRLTNFFFRERVLNYEKIRILDHNVFHLYLKGTPLVDPHEILYFTGSAPEALEEILARIINCPTFYDDNKANFLKWNLPFSEITKKCVDSGEQNHKCLNFNILLDIFPGCLTGDNDYFTSLTANIESESIDRCKAYPADKMHYRCLYPVSETVYGDSGHKCRILKRHVSPIAIGDPKLCSLPLFRTEFLIENPTDETLDIAILQIQENIVGYEIIKSRVNEQDAVFYIQRSVKSQVGEQACLHFPGNKNFKGVTLKQKPDARPGDIDGQLHFGVYGTNDDEIYVTCCGSDFSEKGPIKLWNALRTGRINHRALPSNLTGREPTSGAVCVNKILKPGESFTFNFVTVLDFPHVRLNNYTAPKKYVEYFPDSGTRLRDILGYYLNCHASDVRFEQRFCQSIVRRLTDRLSKLGMGLKSVNQLSQLLVNSLSFLAEATIWDDKNFNIRECVDYPFFNSLDVYFYGSFGLMYFLPQVDTSNINAFSECVFSENGDKRRYWMYNYLDTGELPESYYGARLPWGVVPHDMGSAFDPQPNAYTWNDSNTWKDLAPKYVLLVLRSYRYGNDPQVLKDSWPAVNCALESLSFQIEPGHCIPLVDGTGDTFDNIASYGISIYCASLWIAGLRAASEIAKILQEDEFQKKYAGMARSAQNWLRAALWDEEKGYYHYYSAPLSISDVDQGRIGIARTGFERLNVKYAPEDSNNVNAFVIEANKYIYDNEAVVPATYLKMYARSIHKKDDAISWSSLSAKSRKTIRKYALYAASDGLIKESFEKKILQESDDIFADQLVADLYLSLLGLEPITSRKDRKRALQSIFYVNYKTNSPDIGAANLVTPDGKSLPEAQAQDVWVGIQYSIAASLLDCGMRDEFDELIMTVYKNIYSTAKIPFGVPEAFNCNSIFSHHYMEEHLSISSEIAESVIRDLQEIGILSETMNVKGEILDRKRNMVHSIMRKHNLPDLSEALIKLLQASIKYTAGRYFRAGMVFSIVAIIDQLHCNPGKPALQDKRPGKEYAFSDEQ